MITTLASVTGVAAPSTVSTNWLEYHGSPASRGVASSLLRVNTSAAKWVSPALDGALYSEPLVFGAMVYVATENDSIYALNAQTGRVLWRRHLAAPVPTSDLPCGNISPTVGITGTPAIDPSRHELFAVADELIGGHAQHFLVGVNTSTGALEMRRNVDLTGMAPANYLQRTGLVLDAGRVLFGESGNYGDCATYRGRLYSVAESGRSLAVFTIDRAANQSQGGIWMGGAAPVVDRAGHVWVTSGNGSVRSSGVAYDNSDGVLELTPTLRLLQHFAPANWPQQNAQDQDMSSSPSLLANGLVLLSGKSSNLYVERASHLSGIGGELATVTKTCSNDIDGGSVVLGDTAILPCLSGPEAVRVSLGSGSRPVVTALWQASDGGGPPIYAAHEIWTIGSNGVLDGLSLASGHVVQSATLEAPANHFDTPSVGDHELLVDGARRVFAFSATL